MGVIAFEVAHRPVSQGSLSPVLVKGRPGVRYLNADTLYEWRAAIARACPLDDPQPGEFRVQLIFRLPRPKAHYGKAGTVKPGYLSAVPLVYPDLDKLVRGVLDALTGRVWADDSQVSSLLARKRYVLDGEAAGLDVWISWP
jgi:Holliday junction resolvase RusA-like endonuclease